MNNQRDALVVLADGWLMAGWGFGAKTTAIGEVVFNTGMTGYQEVITDPSYGGQLITFTYPELGNTGINDQDYESQGPAARGVICRQVSPIASSWRQQYDLGDWLHRHGVVGIRGLDTRALVRHLREQGAMNGAISWDGTSAAELLHAVRSAPSMEGLDLTSTVSTPTPFQWNHPPEASLDPRLQPSCGANYRVVAIDFGIKRGILQRLSSHGCAVTVLPSTADYDQVMAYEPEGIFLSNGPGDPAAVHSGIALTRRLLQQERPVFGICLGCQIIALALGAQTFKLTYGHRGLNHPCGGAGRVEITSQNHGFAIDPNTLPPGVQVHRHNLNDSTVAGLELEGRPIFGIQYHPEASPGPHDADHHFNRFTAFMEKGRQCCPGFPVLSPCSPQP